MPYDDAEEGVTSFLTNPRILWSTANAHNVEIYAPIPTDARVRQNYGAYVPYSIPCLTDYSMLARVTDGTDGFTDVAEKRMRVHFPIEEWQRTWRVDHPQPVKPVYERDENSPDWVYGGELGHGPRTYEVEISWRGSVTNSGTISGGYQIQGGDEVLKIAFLRNEQFLVGYAIEFQYTERHTFQLEAGYKWRWYWAYNYDELGGKCDLYDEQGFVASADWYATRYIERLPGVPAIVVELAKKATE